MLKTLSRSLFGALKIAALMLWTLTVQANTEARVRAPVVLGEMYIGEVWVYPNPENAPEGAVESTALHTLLMQQFSQDYAESLSFLRKEERLSFRDLVQAGIDASFNDESLTLFLKIDASKLKQTQMRILDDRDAESGALIVKAAPWSGFVNFKVSETFGKSNLQTDWQRQGTYGEVDWVHSQGSLRLVNRFNASENSSRSFQRRETYAFYDFEDSSSRLSTGDIYPRLRSFQRGRSLLGVSYSKESQLQRWWQYQNTASKEIILDSPSTVEIYVNGALRDRFDAPAGPLLLDQIPLYSGRNNVEIKIRDRFGKEQTVSDAFFHDQSLLRKGEHDYALSAGYDSRLSDGERRYNNEDPYVSAYHRYGLLQTLEAGWNTQASSKSWLLGLESRSANSWGLWSLEGAYSSDASKQRGQAITAAWNSLEVMRTLPLYPSLNSQIEWQSEEFNSPLAPVANASFKARALQTLALRTPSNINHILSYYRTWSYDKATSNTFRYDVRKTLSREWSVGASYETQWDNPRQNNFFISLSWMEAKNDLRVQSEYATFQNAGRLSVEHTPSDYVQSFHQRAYLEGSDIQSRVGGELGYRGRRALAQVEYQNLQTRASNFESDDVSFNASTSLAYTPNAIGIGQPIYDSFAIFRAKPTLRGKDELIIGSNSEEAAAVVDSWGTGVLSNLSSQSKRVLQISSADPEKPIHVNEEFVRLDARYYRGLEVLIEQSKPLALSAKIVDASGKAQVFHSGRWVIKNAANEEVDSGEVFSGTDGNIFIEAKTWAPQLVIDINHPAPYSILVDLSAAQNSPSKVFDLGSLSARKVTQP